MAAFLKNKIQELNRKKNDLETQHHTAFLVLSTTFLLSLATGFSALFFLTVPNTYVYNITLIYILALVLIAYLTANYYAGFAASFISIFCINYFYTYPYFKLHFTLAGYPITFLGMFTISLVTSTAATHMRKQAQIIAEKDKFFLEAEKEKTKANLMRAISHDIRTPLTSIMGSSTSYLENGEFLSEEEKKKLISNIRDDSQWLLHMVENILSVTRINDAGTAALHTSTELVEEVLEEAATRFKKRMPEVSFCMQVPDEPILVPMDALLIEQVIINLLENAAYHGQSSRPIECYVEEKKDSVLFYVRDYGKGISEEKLNTLFEVAPSSNHSVDSHKGMGIGFSICKSIVRAHGGHIQGKNCQTGCEFSFSLPKGGHYES